MTKVLFVSNMYPNTDPRYPYSGIFVKEQLDALSSFNFYSMSFYLIRGFKSPIYYVYDSFFLLFYLIKNRPDIVHFHYGISALILFFDFLIPKRIKFVVTFHGGDILPLQGKFIQVYLSKLLAKRADYLIVLNKEMESEIISSGRSFQIIPCGVDCHLFSPGGKSIDEIQFVFPGDPLRSVKNFDFFKRIFFAFSKKFPKSTYRVMHGLSRSEVANVLRESTLLLMTSISEGSPQSVKEALASDIAVVSTDVGDVASVLGNVAGTNIIDQSMSDELLVDIIEHTIKEARSNKGKRKSRLESICLDNKSVSLKILDVYKDLLC